VFCGPAQVTTLRYHPLSEDGQLGVGFALCSYEPCKMASLYVRGDAVLHRADICSQRGDISAPLVISYRNAVPDCCECT